MGRHINTNNYTKQYILSKISQELIFSTYFNIPIETIQYCIKTNELIISPIREDNHPTCGFRYDTKGRLKFRDFAGYFWGDCFDAVALVISKAYGKEFNVNNKQDFVHILKHISLTFKDIINNEAKDPNIITKIEDGISKLRRDKPIIDLVIREWNKDDIAYWAKFGISIRDLNINFVYPVDQFYINRKQNPEPKYYYDEKDPCYAYYLGKGSDNINNYKLYFPKRTKDSHSRFICNCNHLEGILNLTERDYTHIIITKSTKDRIALGSTLRYYTSLYRGANIKVGVINIPHETYRLRDIEIDWLKDKLRFDGEIVTFMDNDRTGIMEAIYLRKEFGFKAILIPKEYGAKDFAELNAITAINVVCELIKKTIEELKYDRRKNISRTTVGNVDTSLPF